MTYSIPSQTHTARVMLAVFLLTGAAGISVQAAASTGGGTAKDQPVTVTDDFNIENRTAPAAVVIAASAAKTTDDVTNVGTKSITASFSNKSEANGIWVQHDYPGTVNLVDGLQIKVTSNGRPTSVSTGNSNMKFSHNLCKTWDVAFLIDAYLKKRLWEILW